MVPSLLAETPAPILLLAFLVIGVGGILLVSHLFYGRFIAMVQEDPVPETGSDADSESSTESSAEADTKADAKAESTEPVTPGPNDLRGRVLTFTTLAFVFMLAFVLNTSWGNVQDAQYATQTEGAAIAQLLNLTDHFEDPQTAEAVQTAVLDYTNTIVNEQWPLLEVADGLGASAVGLTASTALGDRILAAKAADESSSPVWGQIETTLGDLGQASVDRLRDLPTSNAPFRIGLVIVLGATMLIATAAFLPTRIKAYRAALVLMAALVSLLVFAMVQTSNPYAQNITPAPLVLAERLSTQ